MPTISLSLPHIAHQVRAACVPVAQLKPQQGPSEQPQLIGPSIERALRHPWALAETSLKLTQRLSWSVPCAVARRLTPLCTTQAAHYALVGAFVGTSLLLPLGLTLAAELVRNRWHQALFNERLAALNTSAAAQPQRWNLPAPKPSDADLPTLCAQEIGDEGLFLDQMTLAAASDIVTFVATAVVDLAQLWWFSSPIMLAVAIGAAGLAYALGNLRSGPPVYDSIELRRARQVLLAQGPGFWDNVVIGNEINSDPWHRKMKLSVQNFFAATHDSLVRNFAASEATPLPYLLPIYADQAEQFLPQTTSPNPLVQRALPGLQAMASTAANGFRLSQLNLRLIDIKMRHTLRQQAFAPLMGADTAAGPIELSELKLFSQGHQLDIAPLLDNMELLRAPRRCTLRGLNGRGKTNVLLRIKQHFKTDAFYLPTVHVLNFPIGLGSPGEKVMQVFEYLDKQVDKPQVILLDEWAARLDTEHRSEIDDMVLRWSQKHSVIEVAH
jgi:hypothetical protein